MVRGAVTAAGVWFSMLGNGSGNAVRLSGAETDWTMGSAMGATGGEPGVLGKLMVDCLTEIARGVSGCLISFGGISF